MGKQEHTLRTRDTDSQGRYVGRWKLGQAKCDRRTGSWDWERPKSVKYLRFDWQFFPIFSSPVDSEISAGLTSPAAPCWRNGLALLLLLAECASRVIGLNREPASSLFEIISDVAEPQWWAVLEKVNFLRMTLFAH